MLFSGLPIVEMGTITEVYADCFDIEVVGDNFWVMYYRVLRPPGDPQMIKVPTVRVGRSLASFVPNTFARALRAGTH